MQGASWENRKARLGKVFLVGMLAMLPAIACDSLSPSAAPRLQETQAALETAVNEISTQVDRPTPFASQETGPTQPPALTESPTGSNSVTYDVRETVVLTNDGPGMITRVQLWVAMIRDLLPYQDVTWMQIEPADSSTVTDEHGNQFALFEIGAIPVGGEVVINLEYQVTVYRLDFDLGSCQGALLSQYIQPERYIESDDPVIVNLANQLSQGASTACQQVRSFYDYVGETISYGGYIPQDVGALGTLNDLEADCTGYSDLLMALSRAHGIPARFLEGVTCCTNGSYSEADIKHDWLEIYLPGAGWVPMDPTWGRSPGYRETYFAAITPDHIVVTQGRNLTVLDGYHYFYYLYWWGNEASSVSSQEEWSIVKQTQ